MGQRARITITMLSVAAVSHAMAPSGAAHPGHHEPTPGAHHPAADEMAAPGAQLPLPNPPDDPADTIGRCRWRAESSSTDTGGALAECEGELQFPVTAGVFVHDFMAPDHKGLVNLAPAWWTMETETADGYIDGEPLSDDHPWAHGEPPPDQIETEWFHPILSASGIHYENGTGGPVRENEIRTLCCETLPAKPNIGALEDCHYETALVLVQPEANPALPGQYTASLACSEGRITSGGCYAQFLHDTPWALTGSHPYEGDPFSMPDGDHDALQGETGWACRLDQEPDVPYPPDYEEGIAVTALCCK